MNRRIKSSTTSQALGDFSEEGAVATQVKPNVRDIQTSNIGIQQVRSRIFGDADNGIDGVDLLGGGGVIGLKGLGQRLVLELVPLLTRADTRNLQPRASRTRRLRLVALAIVSHE